MATEEIFLGDIRLVEKYFNRTGADQVESADLVFNTPYSNEDLNQLAQLLTKFKADLACRKLTLYVDKEMLRQEGIIAILSALKGCSNCQLQLAFPTSEFADSKSEILAKLLEITRGNVDYPLVFCEQNTLNTYYTEEFNELRDQLIASIHKRNASLFLSTKIEADAETEEAPLEREENSLARKIKLKVLLNPQLAESDQYNNYVKLEVQHTEVVEEQEVIEEQEEVIQEHRQEMDQYEGVLVGFAQFSTEPYASIVSHRYGDEHAKRMYGTLRNELFANLPNAIKYLTPNAAQEFAKQLPALTSLNPDKLPPFFYLKKTAEGALVLDYDAFTEEKESTPYTPQAMKRFEDKPIYPLSLMPELIKSLMHNDILFDRKILRILCIFFAMHNNILFDRIDRSHLVNLWIKYGDQGTDQFFKKLNELDEQHPGYAPLLYDAYLRHFSQWDHLVANRDFFNSIDLIKSYDKTKLKCLFKFLQNTGSSRHDLKATLTAYETFWTELQKSCGKQKVSIEGINTSWSTPQGGNPVVYIDRLATLLRNSRNVAEQFECLEGISLDSYGAYYASKYEGFKVVSKEMDFKYEAEKCDEVAFYPDKKLYRVELSDLNNDFIARYMCLNPNLFCFIDDNRAQLSNKEFQALIDDKKVFRFRYAHFKPPMRLYERTADGGMQFIADKLPIFILKEEFPSHAYRYIGEQLHGITIKSYVKSFDLFKSHFSDWVNLNGVIYSSLFFLTHERYLGTDSMIVPQFFVALERATGDKVLDTVNANLLKLYKSDLKLNEVEGLILCNKIAMMNSAEFEFRHGHDKVGYIEQLFCHFQENKYATLKCIKLLGAGEFPFIYALDTAEFLAENPDIRAVYQDDILVFSTLINSVNKELYYKARKDASATPILERLTTVRAYLSKAAIGGAFNNWHYAIKAIVQSKNFFGYEQFLSLMADIDKLSALDTKAVDEILSRHKFTITATLPDFSFSENDDVKASVIKLMIGLRAIKKHGVTSNVADHFLPPLSVSPQEREEMLLAQEALDKNQIQWADDMATLTGEDEVGKLGLKQKKARFEAIVKRDAEEKAALRSFFSRVGSEDDETEREVCVNSKESLPVPNRETLEQRRLELQYERNMHVAKDLLLKEKDRVYKAWEALYLALAAKSITELDIQFKEELKTSGTLISLLGSQVLKPILNALNNALIGAAVAGLTPNKLSACLKNTLYHLKDFKDFTDFEKINRINQQATKLVDLFNELMKRDNFIHNEGTIAGSFETVNFEKMDYETLFAIITLLLSMPQRNYSDLLPILFDAQVIVDKARASALIGVIDSLHQNGLPTQYITKLAKLYQIEPTDAFRATLQDVVSLFENNKDDAVLKFLLHSSSINAKSFSEIIRLTRAIEYDHEKLQQFFVHLEASKQLPSFLERIASLEKSSQILEIIAKSVAVTPAKELNVLSLDYAALAQLIGELGVEQVDKLSAFFKTTTASVGCLELCLRTRDSSMDFNTFLGEFEKAPFGPRNFLEQFDRSQVVRVINETADLRNQTAYPYHYRKQMMEAFLFVNEVGNNLAVYYNKPAKDLSNAEIKQLFVELKSPDGRFNGLDPFQRRLYALGLMREAMYRSTGQFPYSTQIISLIDCMMHEGDVLSNIDTGQGKSLIDTMKACLLWLDGDRTDISTSSITDAKRDIAIYAPFLDLLGVPYSKIPISSTSDFGDYQLNGINYSTFSQLSLFFAKARVEKYPLGTEQDKVSLVMNESDFSISDDRTIYRFATTSGTGVGNEWIYTAINEYVTGPSFQLDDLSEEQDILGLRRYLTKEARAHGKSGRTINKFDDAQLLTWIESAILVNYKLRENFDYVLTPEPEAKMIHGDLRMTRAAKILMKDGRVSPDSQYGNGIQQLLYAKLNAASFREDFVIEPETHTLFASNNKNLVDGYRARHGLIWGSSGTVGSEPEREEQFRKYGFAFSKIAPHQKNRVVVNKPVFLADEAAHFAEIHRQLMLSQEHAKKTKTDARPSLVFCKDINTARRFFAYLADKVAPESAQLFVGLGNEEKVIADAAIAGKITVTTSAIGRNTDIHYNHAVGMDVYQTFVSSSRSAGQKSGRTGRQGSEGAVHYILNQEDLQGRTTEQIQALIDEKSARERQFNEELYDVLHHLFQHLESISDGAIPIKEGWADFSAQVEALYHDMRMNSKYKRNVFVERMVDLFHEQFKELFSEGKFVPLIAKDVLLSLQAHPQSTERYASAKEHVALSDCISPEMIAYHLMQFKQEPKADLDKAALKNQLTAMFGELAKGNYEASNAQYIRYLNSTNAEIAQIHEVHKEFLQEHLKQLSHSASNKSFFARWFGFDSQLNLIANSKHYLMIFKALTQLKPDEAIVNLEDLKQAMVGLIDEYLQSSWFINKSRKEASEALKTDLRSAPDVASLLSVLVRAKVDILNHDIKENEGFWRTFKKVNGFGHSRLQTSLDNALELAVSLTGKDIPADLVTGLTTELKSAVVNPKELAEFEKDTSYDSFSLAKDTLKPKDRGNAMVAEKSLKRALKSSVPEKYSKGMSGRVRFFNSEENEGPEQQLPSKKPPIK